MMAKPSSVVQKEVKHFSKDAKGWWDEQGPFAPLHRLNPARIGYIKDHICRHFDLNPLKAQPFNGLSLLDIGCGGGLVCEPMTRLGADVTGIDADSVAIDVAVRHAKQSGLSIRYVNIGAEALTETFDVVLALEIIEHVGNPKFFLEQVAAMVKPGGLLIISTLNRTMKSFALGIMAAEYILNWVPRGTHSWKKFLKPSEIIFTLRKNGFTIKDISGLIFDPLRQDFQISDRDIDVNYLIVFSRLNTAS